MVKRHQRHADGLYHIKGRKYKMLRGSRAQVWHQTAHKTQGGLEKHQLMMNKHGRIVSRKKHNTAKREQRLKKAGYGTQKGKFGAVRIGSSRRKRSGTRKVTIKEKRNIRSGRFSKGGRRRRN